MFDLMCLNDAFDSASHISHMSNGDSILWRKISLAVLAEKVVRFILGSVFGCEFCYCDSLPIRIVGLSYNSFHIYYIINRIRKYLAKTKSNANPEHHQNKNML